MGQALQHQPDHRGVNYRCAGRAEPLIVHAEPATLPEPAEGLFDDAATGPHADVLPTRNTVIPPAIPGSPRTLVTTPISQLAFRKPTCDNPLLTETI
jgi:hypothetical protein